MYRTETNPWHGAFLALALLCVTASADPVDMYTGNVHRGAKQIMNGARPEDGTVNLTGRGRQTLRGMVLGLDFRVMAHGGIMISELGIWDDAVYDRTTGITTQALSSWHSISIWDLSTETLLYRMETGPGTGDLRADFRYFELADPMYLAYGMEYSVAVGYRVDNADSNGNSGRVDQDLEPVPTIHDSNGALLGLGGARFGFDLEFPGIADTGPPNRYHSGTFTYTVLPDHGIPPVPEPDTLVFLLLALAAAAAARAWGRS